MADQQANRGGVKTCGHNTGRLGGDPPCLTAADRGYASHGSPGFDPRLVTRVVFVHGKLELTEQTGQTRSLRRNGRFQIADRGVLRQLQFHRVGPLKLTRHGE